MVPWCKDLGPPQISSNGSILTVSMQTCGRPPRRAEDLYPSTKCWPPSCFTTKRIHLGMDEAYDLGRGHLDQVACELRLTLCWTTWGPHEDPLDR